VKAGSTGSVGPWGTSEVDRKAPRVGRGASSSSSLLL
jgi:hypothetical protein